jgi:hypothetical protein
MDFNTTIDIIIKDLKEAREIIDDLKNYPGVPQLQVELAKSKCKSAEEIIAFLKTYKTNSEAMHPVTKESVPVHPESKKDNIENLIELTEDETGDIIKHEVIEDSDNKIQGDLWPEKDLNQDEKLPQSPIEKEPSIFSEKTDFETATGVEKNPKEKRAEISIVADKFSHKSNTLYEQFGRSHNEDDISASLKTKPIENLSDAIGLNDKFLFIKEIFGGSITSYDEAITRLNKVENLPDAKAIIMSYTDKGDDNEVVYQLLNLVKRKLPSDG